MIRSLVERYERGAITADHLIWEFLHALDPDQPGLLLSVLPPELIARMYHLTEGAIADELVTNFVPLPTQDQIDAAREWIGHTVPEIA